MGEAPDMHPGGEVRGTPLIPAPLRDLRLRDYRPRSSLHVAQHRVARARFPVVDAHNHLGRWLTQDWGAPDVGALLALMDELNLRAIVNLDGRPGELDANLARYDRAVPGRFATFAQVDWDEPARGGDFGARMAATLRQAVAAGAHGMKVWKILGLHVRDDAGELVMPDDDRLDPLWAAAAGAAVPVLIHVGDPVAFFDPLDAENERLEELIEHPDWWFGDRGRFPPFLAIVDALERLVARHPSTTFIGAHVGCYPEDLAWVGRMFATYPNFHADIAARIAELGRQPRAARDLIMAHPDRILFGTDESPPNRETYITHFRFLETVDESFPYAVDPVPPQGRWAISGLGLPDDILRKVYGENALRLVPGLAT
jgi:predicted TIM-barrel fold metal-dependent hydrolase